jgi:extracellular factor (EF) 3-hydroxypalmitic acid methyl ester biosynthesis protein
MNDQALTALRAASERLGAMAGDDFTHPESFHDVAAAIHHLCGRIAVAERAGAEVPAIQDAVQIAWEVHGRSPFIRRWQTWPRGYPGDFETIEYVMGQRVQAPPRTLEYWVEYLALNSPPAQQHRNKVMIQAREVTSTILAHQGGSKVLVLAAGSSPDLLLAQHRILDRDFEVVLNDGDEGALTFSTARLVGIQNRVRAVPGNVLSSIDLLAPLGPFHLVVAGGLFDYLPDAQAIFLLRAVWERLLAPKGRFFLTNIKRGNPYRVWMEYLGNWRLIGRSEEELRGLVTAACGPEAVCSIAPEGTGLTWLVSIEREAERRRAHAG